MSTLQDKINNARKYNDDVAQNAIEDIEYQTHNLITDFDRLTIDRTPRESRREAALKILEKARKGEIDKIDEDAIYDVHNNELEDKLSSNNEVNKDKAEDENKNKDDLEVKSRDDFDQLNAIDKLKAISVLINDDQNHDENSDQRSPDESDETVKSNDNNLYKNDKSDRDDDLSDKNIVNEDNKIDQQEKPGFFKKMMNKIFGG